MMTGFWGVGDDETTGTPVQQLTVKLLVERSSPHHARSGQWTGLVLDCKAAGLSVNGRQAVRTHDLDVATPPSASGPRRRGQASNVSAMLWGMDVFADYVLPILLQMSAEPLKSFPLQSRIRDLGIVDEDESTRFIDLMVANGLITVRGGKNGAGVWYAVYDVFLTPKGLTQLNLWPSDQERALFLLEQVVEALDELATEAESSGEDAEKAGRLRAAARGMGAVVREASTEVAAKVISNLATGG